MNKFTYPVESRRIWRRSNGERDWNRKIGIIDRRKRKMSKNVLIISAFKPL